MKEAKHVSVDGAVEKIGSRFELVLVASARAREIKRGSTPRVQGDNGAVVTALEEIEQGLVTKEEYLKKLRNKEIK